METGRLYTTSGDAAAAWYRANAHLPQGTLVTKITRLPTLRAHVPGQWPQALYGFNVWVDGRGPDWIALSDQRAFPDLSARVVRHLRDGGPIPPFTFGAPPQGEVWGVLGPARTPGSLLLARPRYGGGTQRKVVRAGALDLWGVWEPPAWWNTVYLAAVWRRLYRFLPGLPQAFTWEAFIRRAPTYLEIARANVAAEYALACALQQVEAQCADRVRLTLQGGR